MGLFDFLKNKRAALCGNAQPTSSNDCDFSKLDRENYKDLPILAEIKSATLSISSSYENHIDEFNIGDSLRFIPFCDCNDDKAVAIYVKNKRICVLDYSSIKVSIFDILTRPELIPSSIEAIVTKINKKTIKADIIYRCDPTIIVEKPRKKYHYSAICDDISSFSENIVLKKLSQAEEENLVPCQNCCQNSLPRFFYK